MSGRAKCDKEKYTLFFLLIQETRIAQPFRKLWGYVSRCSESFLKREEFTGKDLFEENKDHIESIGCHISVDDTVIDKTFSEERYNDLVRQQYSGRTHKTINGIGIITLFVAIMEEEASSKLSGVWRRESKMNSFGKWWQRYFYGSSSVYCYWRCVVRKHRKP